MSMFSICSFPGIRRGSCRLRKKNNILIIRPLCGKDCNLVDEVVTWKRWKTTWVSWHLHCLFIPHIKSLFHSQSVKVYPTLHSVGLITTVSLQHSFSSLMSSHQKTQRPWCSLWCREQQDLSATDWMAWQHKANYQLLPSLPLPDAMRRK